MRPFTRLTVSALVTLQFLSPLAQASCLTKAQELHKNRSRLNPAAAAGVGSAGGVFIGFKVAVLSMGSAIYGVSQMGVPFAAAAIAYELALVVSSEASGFLPKSKRGTVRPSVGSIGV